MKIESPATYVANFKCSVWYPTRLVLNVLSVIAHIIKDCLLVQTKLKLGHGDCDIFLSDTEEVISAL